MISRAWRSRAHLGGAARTLLNVPVEVFMTRGWLSLPMVFVLAMAATGCSASTDDGTTDDPNAEGADEGELRGGERLTASQVADLVRNAGFPSNMIGRMVCTAKWESSFYTKATNKNRNGTTDRGLFQINSIHLGHTKGCPASSSAIFDPETNTRCAYNIYRLQGVNAWYGYKAHKSECDRTRAPAMSLDGPNAPATPDDPNAGDDMTPMTDADMYGDPSFGDAIVAPDRPELPGAPERAPREVPLAGPAEGPYSL
ncbi:MAG: transglycosylase SLT domain-containing protein [Polyangiaceae bacterium]